MAKDNSKKISVFNKTEDDKNNVIEQFNNIYFSIDLNTNKVKQTNQVGFIIDLNKTTEQDLNDIYIDGYLQKIYLDEMYEFNKDIDKYIDKKYKNLDELNDDIFKFNSLFSNNYLYGFNLRIKNYLDEYIKADYINKTADARADIQLTELKQKLDDKTSVLSIDLDNTDAYFIVDKDTLKGIFKAIKNKLDKGDIKDNEVDKQLFIEIKTELIKVVSDKVNKSIKNHLDYYNEVGKLYNEVDSKIIKIVDNFKNASLDLNRFKDASIPTLPKDKNINLYASKMFNTTYKLGQYTNIDKNNNLKNYIIKLKVEYDSDNKELRDIILEDEIQNKKLQLLPIDLAFFVGFTTINNINGGNTPITLSDAIKFISEDKKARVRKTQKAYQLYDDKMQMFKSFKVKSVIQDKKTKETLAEFKDAIPILENYKVFLPSRNDEGYIIGASAILSILNFLSEREDINYLASFNEANNYINDGQRSELTTLNMKYYIIIKILQLKNAHDNNKQFNPRININEIYKQTALLKGKDELNETERNRERAKINTFLDHLKETNLLYSYSYTPFKQLTSDEDKNNSLTTYTNKSKNNLYIKFK